MKTTQEGRDRLRRLVDAAKPRYTKVKKEDHPIIKLLDDADELARAEATLAAIRADLDTHRGPGYFGLGWLVRRIQRHGEYTTPAGKGGR